MFSLNRLNKRLKHLLFHTLLQQEVNFFDDNKPGEKITESINWLKRSCGNMDIYSRHFSFYFPRGALLSSTRGRRPYGSHSGVECQRGCPQRSQDLPNAQTDVRSVLATHSSHMYRDAILGHHSE